jgi:putative DNA primase/helicase
LTISIETAEGDDRIIEHALFYNSKGYNVRPILRSGQRAQRWNFKEQKYEEVIGDGKKAEGTGAWIGTQTNKQSTKDVEELFSQYKSCNIALIQGKISGCKFVIDIDQGADDVFQEAITLLPESLADKLYKSLFVKTGNGGLHIYLGYNQQHYPYGLHLPEDKKVLHRNGKGNEIAVKADGSYVIAPPSINSTDNQYEVLRGDWDNILVLTKQEIEQLFSAIKQTSEKYTKILVRRKDDNKTDKFEQLQHTTNHYDFKQITPEVKNWIIETFTPFMIDTHKHNTKFALAGILRKDYFLNEEDTLKIINSIHDDPHKNSQTVRDVYRREGYIVGYTMLSVQLAGMTDHRSAKKIVGELKKGSCRRAIEYQCQIEEKSSAENQQQQSLYNILEDSNACESEKMAFLVEEVMKNNIFRTFKDTEEILYYKDGKYHKGGTQEIKKELEKIGGYSITTHKRKEVINHIIAKTMVAREEFDKDIDIINLKNCLVNIRTGEVKEHSPEYLSIIQIPVKYNPNAYPRKTLDFMYNVVEPSDVPLMIDYISYCLIRNTRLQKDLLCMGEEDNGKSVMLKLITAFLGTENISSRTLYSLVTERFAKADLCGKLANIFADISSKRLTDIETFKVLASGDRITAENKFENSFEFEPTAKLIFSANILPRPSEDMLEDNSYYKRWILVQFNLRDRCFFCGKNIVKDPDLIDKLTTEQELSGLLNLVLIAAKRLLTRRRFVKSPSIQEIKERYQTLADPVKAWLDDRCLVGPEYEGNKEELHADFIDYCWAKKLRRLEINALGRALSKYNIRDKRKGSEREHVWSGVMVRTTTHSSTNVE